MASTITRDVWVDDSGSPSSPVGDGTIVGNTQLQNNIYARVDQMFTGAGVYSRFEFGNEVFVPSILWVNETANAFMTTGLTINQAGAAGEILCLKSTAVAHGVTTITETDTYGLFKKADAATGGLQVRGFNAGTGVMGVQLQGVAGTKDATKSTASRAIVTVNGAGSLGTGTQDIGTDGNVVCFQSAGVTRHIFDVEGDSHQDIGTAWTTFDEHDDVALIEAIEANLVSNPIDRAFSHWVDGERERLAALKLVTFNPDGHHFVNRSRMQNLLCGAIRQLAAQQQQFAQRLLALET